MNYNQNNQIYFLISVGDLKDPMKARKRGKRGEGHTFFAKSGD